MALVVATACMLQGCAVVGPEYHRRTESTIERSAANGPFLGGSEAPFDRGPVRPDWWRLYESVALEQLVQEALAANTDLRAAVANIARATAGLDHADAARRPSTDLQVASAYARRSAEEELIPGGRALPDRFVYGIGVGVSYQVDLVGQVSRTIESARADLAAARAARDAVLVTVAAETTRAYLEVCSAGRELAVIQRSVALQVKSTGLTRTLFDAGRGNSVDTMRSSVEEDQVRARIPTLNALRRLALYRLSTLTGRAPGEYPRGVESCDVEPRLTHAIPIGDGASLLRRRPDVRRAEFDARAATARVGVAIADLYPRISLGASVGSVGLGKNFLDADTFKFSLGPLITWQFPNRTRVRSRIASADAELQMALARFDGAVLAALKETESALETYSRDLERRSFLEAARHNATRVVRDTEQLFTAGRQGYLPVLDATRTLIGIEQSVAAADSKLASDQVDLFLALGGGWKDDQMPPE